MIKTQKEALIPNLGTHMRIIKKNFYGSCAIRGQLEIIKINDPIDISSVEPASEIVKRFTTGAMSFASIS